MTMKEIIDLYNLDYLGVEIEDNNPYIILQSVDVWLYYIRDKIIYQDFSLDKYDIKTYIQDDENYGLIILKCHSSKQLVDSK